MNEIWMAIEPYISSVLTVLISGGLGAFLVRLLASGWFRKTDLNTLSERFADKLLGSTINVDLKAVTEKQLDKINALIEKQLEDFNLKLNAISNALADVISSIKSSAKLKQNEVDTLIADLEALKISSKAVEAKDEITIELKRNSATNSTGKVKTDTKTVKFE